MSLPRNLIGVPRETSSLLPAVDSSSPAHTWKQVAQGNERASALTNALSVANQKMMAIHSQQATMGMHPWKIYPYVRGSIPSIDNLSAFRDPDTWWRTIRVRTGAVTGYSRGRNAFGQAGAVFSGCDCEQRGAPLSELAGSYGWPHTSDTLRAIPRPFNTYQDEFEARRSTYVCEDDAYTWIVAELQFVAGLGLIEMGVHVTTDPTADTSWRNFPEEDPYFFLIGMVDTVMFRGQDYPDTNPNNPPSTAHRRALCYNFRYDAINIDIAPKFYGEWVESTEEQPVSEAGAILGTRGYPFNALVHKDRTKSATTRTATYQSRKWFNTDEPSDETDDSWILVGESAQ